MKVLEKLFCIVMALKNPAAFKILGFLASGQSRVARFVFLVQNAFRLIAIDNVLQDSVVLKPARNVKD